MTNIFNVAKRGLADGTLDLDVSGTTIDMLLFTLSPEVELLTAEYDALTVAAVKALTGFTEAADATYTTTTDGRRTVAIAALELDTAADHYRVKFTPTNGGVATWVGIDNDVIDGCLFYVQSVALGNMNDSDAGCIPVAYCDLTADVTTTGGDLTITFANDFFMSLDN